MRHYVPVFQHRDGRDDSLCQGHAAEAFSSRSDAAAAVADVLELGEIEELVLLDTDSITKPKDESKKMLYDVVVTLKVCDCATFVGEPYDNAPFKLEGVGDNRCDLIRELHDDDEDDDEDDGLESFVSGFNKRL